MTSDVMLGITDTPSVNQKAWRTAGGSTPEADLGRVRSARGFAPIQGMGEEGA